MSSQQHQAKFTWGVGPQVVTIAGNFNNWSPDASPLKKLPDGSFAAEVGLPWGEKQAFKYVVDGEWKVREDEAKEWDAAGNMNNVYTAPHAPSPPETKEQHSSPSSAAAAPASSHSPTTETSTRSEPASTLPSSDTKPVTTGTETTSSAAKSSEPSTLLASSAPGPASASNPYVLGAIAGGSSASALGPSSTSTKTTSSSAPPAQAFAPIPVPTALSAVPANVSSTTADSTPPFEMKHLAPHVVSDGTTTGSTTSATSATSGTQPIPSKPEPSHVAIEKTARNANVGEASVGDEHTLLEKATEIGAGAAATIGSYLGSAAAAVERATGIDLTHGEPLTVEEAKAKGIDVRNAEKIDATTHTTSPVGAKPPASAVDALEEKIQALKVDHPSSGTAAPVPSTSISSKASQTPLPLPNQPKPQTSSVTGRAPSPLPADDDNPNDIPAQHETKANHTHVPMPTIVAVSPRDPTKDRTLNSTNNRDTAGTKPISNDPAVDPKEAKAHAEENPGLPGKSYQSAETASTGTAVATPTAANANSHVDEPSKAKSPLGSHTASSGGVAGSDLKKDTLTSSSSGPAPAAVPATPTPIAKDTVSSGSPAPTKVPTPVAVAPATPAKPTAGGVSSAASTPASTPAKSSMHGKDASTADSAHKKKSGFLTKIKSAFHSPKDKEKK